MTQYIHSEARIDASAIIGSNVVIGRAIIEANVIIESGVAINDGVRLAEGVKVYNNSVLGRLPQAAGIIQRKPKTDLPWLDIGAGSVIGANVVLYRGTTIGSNTLVGDLSCIREECAVGDNVVIGRNVMLNYNIIVHNRVRIMDSSHFGGDMIIEDDVFIGPHVSSANDNTMGLTQVTQRQGAIIRRGASVGVGVILLAGIEIGEQAIIGAGALVNSDIPRGVIAIGTPARVLRDAPSHLLKPIQSTNEVSS